MKTTEFLKESSNITQESPEDTSMVKNNLHTIMRVTADLASRLKGNEDLDEWVKEKIAVAKSMMVTVEDYIASQQEMGEEPAEFNVSVAEQQFAESLNENATGGATGSPSIGVSITSQGTIPTEMIARQKTYTNQRTKGGPVKVKETK
jgi:ribosomal protein L11